MFQALGVHQKSSTLPSRRVQDRVGSIKVTTFMIVEVGRRIGKTT